MSATVETAAREFAAKLRASPPIAAYWEAKGRLEADEEAQRLLAELQRQQRGFMLKQQNGDEVIQEEIDALRALQQEVKRSRAIAAYFRSQQGAQAFLPLVNREISELLGFDFGSLAGAAGG